MPTASELVSSDGSPKTNKVSNNVHAPMSSTESGLNSNKHRRSDEIDQRGPPPRSPTKNEKKSPPLLSTVMQQKRQTPQHSPRHSRQNSPNNSMKGKLPNSSTPFNVSRRASLDDTHHQMGHHDDRLPTAQDLSHNVDARQNSPKGKAKSPSPKSLRQ